LTLITANPLALYDILFDGAHNFDKRFNTHKVQELTKKYGTREEYARKIGVANQ
jgi:hypothetical protein